MSPYKDVQDIAYILYVGENVESIAKEIMKWLKETPIDFHRIWKDVNEYDKYDKLDEYVEKLCEPYYNDLFEPIDKDKVYKLFD